LKPENIMYDPGTRIVKLLDFGIRGTRAATGGRLTRTGFFVGTLQYVRRSPVRELVDGRAASTAWHDHVLPAHGAHPYVGGARELFQQLAQPAAAALSQAAKGIKVPPGVEARHEGLARQPADASRP